MFALFLEAFEGITWDRFIGDLDVKNWVVLLGGRDGEPLQGFTTLHWHQATHEGRSLNVVYSGDTIVDPKAADSAALSRTWIGAINHLARAQGGEPPWWLLISSGYRTYRFLPLYWRRFHPRHDEPTPPEAQRVMDALATARFGPQYLRERGIVRFPHPQILRPHLRGIAERRLKDPHVAFFVRVNPDHHKGDELVCLTRLSSDNLTPAGERMWLAGDRVFARTEARM